MTPKDRKPPALNEAELNRLNRKEKSYWFLTTILLVILSITVIVQYLSANGFMPRSLDFESHYRTTLSVGLPGLIILFVLYTTAKRKEILYLKNTLFSQQYLLRRLADRTRELEDTNGELQKVAGLKDMLISTVSHELQTPLSSIYTISQTLLNYEEADEETTNKFYRLISEESKRLSDLVRNLLDLAKMESGTMDWQIANYEAAELIDASCRVSEVLASQRKITIRKKLDPALPKIPTDRDRVMQVMTNLLSNAIKFSPDGSEIEVGAAMATDLSGEAINAVQFSVKDSGVGIPPDQLSKIFDRFHRAATPMGVRAKGTGLGLAISKDIVEHFGGQIWAESLPGLGSTIYFTLSLDLSDHGKAEQVDDTPIGSEAPKDDTKAPSFEEEVAQTLHV
ncbi:MAG: hypothetical protein HKN20_01220 [Gemmatimonadetes bacterium]|nr:hypothetical protein [Gemmatimonadota bacterium]